MDHVRDQRSKRSVPIHIGVLTFQIAYVCCLVMTDMSCPSISNDFDFDWYHIASLLILLNQRRDAILVCCLGGFLLGTVGDVDDLQSCLFVSLERLDKDFT